MSIVQGASLGKGVGGLESFRSQTQERVSFEERSDPISHSSCDRVEWGETQETWQKKRALKYQYTMKNLLPQVNGEEKNGTRLDLRGGRRLASFSH